MNLFGKNRLWSHQRRMISRASKDLRKGNVVVSLPPGAGKSRITLEVAKHFLRMNQNSRVLIVVERRILLDSTWKSEVAKWAPYFNRKIATVDGRSEPYVRKQFWKHAKEYGYVVIATSNTVNRDFEDGALDINDFDLLILDEAQHSVKRLEGSFRRSMNYSFLVAFKGRVIGLTIRSNNSIPERVTACAQLLEAELLTDERAKERVLERNYINIESQDRIEAEEILNGEIAKLVAIFGSRFPRFHGFPFFDLNQTKRTCGISDPIDVKEFNNLAGRYYLLKTIKRYLNEDNSEYVSRKLLPLMQASVRNRLGDILINWEDEKLKKAMDFSTEEAEAERPVLLFVKFRNTALKIYAELRSRGINTGILIGGLYEYPAEKLKEYVRNKISVLVATEAMCGEGLNLQYFRTIMLTGAIHNEFTKLNAEGRIRGGNFVQFVYKGTDEDTPDVGNENSSALEISILSRFLLSFKLLGERLSKYVRSRLRQFQESVSGK